MKNIAEPVRLSAVHAGGGAQRHPRLFRKSAAIAAAICVTVAVSSAIAIHTRVISFPYLTIQSQPVRDTRKAPASRLSIVVLPFTSISPNGDDEVFADALTQDLVTDLSRIADAFVISASTSFTLKDRNISARVVANELNVAYALSGTIRRSGEQIQVTSTLIDAATGAVLWSERYDRTRSDIYSLQQQLTGQLARTLNLELKDAASRKAARGAPADLEAQDYAVRAWAELWTKPQSRQTNDASLAFIAKALALDPDNADALALKSYALVRAARYGWLPGDPAELSREAVQVGERAVSLDPRDADAYFALAFAVGNVGDINRSLDLYRRAQELNPNHAPSYSNYGFSLILNGKPNEATEWIEKGLAISPRDPLVAVWRSAVSLAAVLEHKDELALSAATSAIAANPNHPGPYLHAAVALKRLGRLGEAADMMARHSRVRPGWTVEKQKQSQTGSAAFDRLAASFFEDLAQLGLPLR